MLEPIQLLDLHGIPKVRDSWSFLYLENVEIGRNNHALIASNESGSWEIPTGMLLALLLGPGTSITHEAIKVLSESASTILWVGQEGVRFYAFGRASTKSASNALLQVEAYNNPSDRLLVAKRMYEARFGSSVGESDTLEVLRGREGSRMRAAYAAASKRYDVTWAGRSYGDTVCPVNHALSWSNACLYGVTAAALHAMGWLPQLGFVHTGKALSFVYDIADLYKAEITIPFSFEMARFGRVEEKVIRAGIRDAMTEAKLLQRIPKDVALLFDGIGEFKDVDWAEFSVPPLLDI